MSEIYAVKPFPRASTLIKKSDKELSEELLVLTLSNKLPKIYDENHEIIYNITLEQFKSYLKQSIIVKEKIKETQEYNRKLQEPWNMYLNKLLPLYGKMLGNQDKVAYYTTKVEEYNAILANYKTELTEYKAKIDELESKNAGLIEAVRNSALAEHKVKIE